MAHETRNGRHLLGQIQHPTPVVEGYPATFGLSTLQRVRSAAAMPTAYQSWAPLPNTAARRFGVLAAPSGSHSVPRIADEGRASPPVTQPTVRRGTLHDHGKADVGREMRQSGRIIADQNFGYSTSASAASDPRGDLYLTKRRGKPATKGNESNRGSKPSACPRGELHSSSPAMTTHGDPIACATLLRALADLAASASARRGGPILAVTYREARSSCQIGVQTKCTRTRSDRASGM